jgi:hypothetical protein
VSEERFCTECGHSVSEHGESGCTHGYHLQPHTDLARAYEVCSCRRGRQDLIFDECEAA